MTDKISEKIDDLWNQLVGIEARITVIEDYTKKSNLHRIYRDLERYIIIDVLGSKRQMFQQCIYTFSKLILTEEYLSSEWNKYNKDRILFLINYFETLECNFIDNPLLIENDLKNELGNIDSEYQILITHVFSLINKYINNNTHISL